MRKTFGWIIAGTLLFIGTVLFSYIYQFYGVLSIQSQDWANFGSYIGGTLSPILSMVSILVVFFTVGYQIKEVRRNERIKSHESLVLEKELFLRDIALKPVIMHDDLIKLAMNDLVNKGRLEQRELEYQTDFSNNSVKINYKQNPLIYPKSLHFDSPLVYLNTLVTLLGVDVVKDQYNDSTNIFYDLRNIIYTYASTYGHMVFLLREMVNDGYDINAAKLILGTSHQASQLLYEIGALDTGAFDNGRIISSLGMFDQRTIKVDLNKMFRKELIALKFISQKIKSKDLQVYSRQDPLDYAYNYEVKVIVDGKEATFVRNNSHWSKRTSNT